MGQRWKVCKREKERQRDEGGEKIVEKERRKRTSERE